MKRPFERLPQNGGGQAGKPAARLSPGTYFALLYFLNMSSRALFTPFFTVYLQEKGMQAWQIGWVMDVNSLVIILAQPFWGMAADRARSPGGAGLLLSAAGGGGFQLPDGLLADAGRPDLLPLHLLFCPRGAADGYLGAGWA